MTNIEIKSLYTKTKRAFEKRTGDKHTWVMNARQQKLGTATILVASAYDYERRLAAMQDYYSPEKVKTRTEKSWNFYRDRVAEEEVAEAAGTHSWNPTYWRDILAEKGSLENMITGALAEGERIVAAEQADLARHGSVADQLRRGHAYAEAFIAGPEIQSFLKVIGGTVVVEDKQEHGATYIYVRFHYRATEA